MNMDIKLKKYYALYRTFSQLVYADRLGHYFANTGRL